MNTSSGWSRQPPASLSEREIHWLFAPGSLTERLSALGEYSLEPVDQRHAAACAADASLLGVEPDSPIWVREVVMRLDAQPCVTARSIASARALETQWKPLTGYGSLPLGHILYDDPAIVRAPFECALLMPDDPLDAISRRYQRRDARRQRMLPAAILERLRAGPARRRLTRRGAPNPPPPVRAVDVEAGRARQAGRELWPVQAEGQPGERRRQRRRDAVRRAARGARTRRRARTMDRKRRAGQLTERTVGGRDREGGRAVAVGCAPPPSVAMDRDRLRSVTVDLDRSLSCGRLRLSHSSGAVRS
ncbi:chorismate lyase family protein [Burkholderia pseudomallei]|nr:chorismate lyase family protein [Burkholderia pseudomallei]KGX26958.1 chorismate lyase family protein [Burkholderia pseudomallei]